MSFTENSSVHREEKRRELSAERKTGAHDEQPQADQEDEIAIPDGGFKAWTTLLGTVLIQFAAGYVNAFGVYQDYFVRTFLTDFSSSQISWIGSIAAFIGLSGGAFCGRLFDKGYFYHLIFVGGTLSTFGLFMLSLAQPQQYYQVFLTLGLVFGLGTGMVYIPSIAVTAHHFRRKRPFAMGATVAGTSLGALLHPIMLNNVIHGHLGFANGVRASAGLVGGALLLGGLLARTRLPPKKDQNSISFWTAIKKFSKDTVYVFAVLGTFLEVQGCFFPLFYLQLYSDQKGLNATFGFYSLSILNFASFIGRLTGGLFVNRFGAFNSIIFSTFACTILLFSMLAVQDIAGVTVFSLLYGYFSGVYVTLIAPMLTSLTDDVSELGLRMGIGYAFTGLGSLIGTPITGALLSRNFIWWRPIVYTGMMSLGGMMFFTCSRYMVAKRKGTQWC